MKIKKVDYEYLEFDNGMTITSDHSTQCCEYNYADFTQLEDTAAMDCDFNENLVFVSAEYGFKFGNEKEGKFFVPCYSNQNGCYSYDVDIYFNGKHVLNVEGDEI